MTPERWQLIQDLLERVLSQVPEERSAFLNRTCSSDSDLRREVETLLASSDNVRSSFLEFLPPSVLKAVRGENDIELAATQSMDARDASRSAIGHYHLVRRIGEGGMGEVWLAEQRQPVHRWVALKLIKSGLNSRDAVTRFESERQALALMDHPAIAKVFDAGATPQGAPYFAMEYVAGIPITDYCDEHRLSTPERLELFIQVCEGVQHAHQKAIIHRDLKPPNILVAEVDGKALPKIIDFGVAKALTENLTKQAMLTRTGVLVGTPEYMSPEQASSAGQDIDTQTDVYSLGAVFYELLSGARPISSRNVELEEFLRRLREEDPPKPSAKFSTQPPATSTGVAHKRRTDPQALVRQLRGELDSIALKALDKDRARRYISASEFAADIRRYLNHEAVLAVPPSLAYQARKFARRHRAALATATAFAMVLMAAATVSIRQSLRANREAAMADAVNDFLQNDLLAQAGASAQSEQNFKPDPHLEVRTALDRAALRIEGKFAKQPEVEASIRDTIGWAYVDLGLYPDARKQLERALELRQLVLGAEEVKTLETMTRLGVVALQEGKYAEAEALDSRALVAQRRVLGAENPDTLASMNNLAWVYGDEDKQALAEPLITQAVEIRKRKLGPEHPQTLASMMNLFLIYNDEGKYAQAETLGVETLKIAKRVMGSENPFTLTVMNNLALVYDKEGKEEQAEGMYIQALEIRKRVSGPEHPYTALLVYNLACVAARRGDEGRAIALLSQSVDHGLSVRGDLAIEKDTDFASLHADPRFAALVVHAKQIAEAKERGGALESSR
jgi:eukaryotic-like serine/threonine-protein kinase